LSKRAAAFFGLLSESGASVALTLLVRISPQGRFVINSWSGQGFLLFHFLHRNRLSRGRNGRMVFLRRKMTLN
jgi:hypothetical protein